MRMLLTLLLILSGCASARVTGVDKASNMVQISGNKAADLELASSKAREFCNSEVELVSWNESQNGAMILSNGYVAPVRGNSWSFKCNKGISPNSN